MGYTALQVRSQARAHEFRDPDSVGRATPITADRHSRKAPPDYRDRRKADLRKWRQGLETYVRWCHLPQVARARSEAWGTRYAVWNDDLDVLTPEVIDLAMRVEVELALYRTDTLILETIDASEHEAALAQMLGQAVDHATFLAMVTDAEARLAAAWADYKEKAVRSGGPHRMLFPELVGPDEISQILRVTRRRKAMIWGKFKVRATDDPSRVKPAQPFTGAGSYAGASSLTIDDHRENRQLADLFDRKPETIADWRKRCRRRGESFEEEVAAMKAMLLPPALLEAHQKPGEHAYRAAMRVRKEKAAQPKTTVADRVQWEADIMGCSSRTAWRRRQARGGTKAANVTLEGMSRLVSANVTFGSDSPPVSRGLTLVEPWNPGGEVPPGVTSIGRLSEEETDLIKRFWKATRGRELSAASIRQHRKRGSLERILIEAWDWQSQQSDDGVQDGPMPEPDVFKAVDDNPASIADDDEMAYLVPEWAVGLDEGEVYRDRYGGGDLLAA